MWKSSSELWYLIGSEAMTVPMGQGHLTFFN